MIAMNVRPGEVMNLDDGARSRVGQSTYVEEVWTEADQLARAQTSWHAHCCLLQPLATHLLLTLHVRCAFSYEPISSVNQDILCFSRKRDVDHIKSRQVVRERLCHPYHIVP
jgi:hypothetical protein